MGPYPLGVDGHGSNWALVLEEGVLGDDEGFIDCMQDLEDFTLF